MVDGMTKRGFTIFEFLTYIVLFTFLATSSVSWIVQLWGTFLRQSQSNSAIIGVYTAQDCILRDLRALKNVYRFSNKEIIFATDQKDIAYSIKNSSLIRLEGTYDPIQNTWAHTIKSLIAKRVTHMEWIIQNEHIEFSITIDTHSIRNQIHRKNREIIWEVRKKGLL